MTRKIKTLATFITLLFMFVLLLQPFTKLTKVFADAPTFSWAKRIGGVSNDYINSNSDIVAFDTNNNFVVVGGVTGDADLNGDGDSSDGNGESSTGYGLVDAFVSFFNSSGVYQWSKRLGSVNSDGSPRVGIDENNNVILVGQVQGDADLNGDGDSLDGNGESATGYGSNDIYVSVFNSSGVYQWSKRIGGTNNDTDKRLTIDANNNIIVMDQCWGDVDLSGDGDTADTGESGTGYGSYDFGISAFNSAGTSIWTKRIGSINQDQMPGYGTEMGAISGDNMVITGTVTGDADLNGDGDSLDGNGESATGYGGYDVIISLFNSTTGVYQWSKRLGGANIGGDTVNVNRVDANGTIYLGGRVIGDADLNGDGDSSDGNGESGTGYGNNDAYISVFNSTGVYQWSKRLGGTGAYDGVFHATLIGDELFVTGEILGDADLNGDGDSLDGGGESGTGYSSADVYIAAFDATGTYQWSKRMGGLDYDTPYGIVADSLNNIYIVGTIYSGDADLNGDGDATDGGGELEAGYGNGDGFISVYNSTGTYQWSNRVGGNGWDELYVVKTNTNNNDIAIVGYTVGAADLNGDGDSSDGVAETGVGYGGYDIFISYFSATVATTTVSTTTTSSGGSGFIQIPEASGGMITTLIVSPIEDSNTAGQTVFAIIQPDTIIFDAFFSSVKRAPISFTTNTTTTSPSVKGNTVLAGGGEGILGIKTTIGVSWQIGKVQEIWYKAYPPAGSGYSPARIIPELQSKLSIIALMYKDQDLIPPGQPRTKFNAKSLKLAHSLDGKTWKRLRSSVVDTVNHTVAAVEKVGGYYMIVSR